MIDSLIEISQGNYLIVTEAILTLYASSDLCFRK